MSNILSCNGTGGGTRTPKLLVLSQTAMPFAYTGVEMVVEARVELATYEV